MKFITNITLLFILPFFSISEQNLVVDTQDKTPLVSSNSIENKRQTITFILGEDKEMDNRYYQMAEAYYRSFQALRNEKYVWASKLNMRNSPEINGEIIKQLNRGDKVKILEITDKIFYVTDTLFIPFSKFDKKQQRFIEGKEAHLKKFNGRWIKIISGDQKGYVFDFYLSRLNPNPILTKKREEVYGNIDSQSNYEKEQIGCKGCDDNYTKYTDKKNEIVIENGIKGKCYQFGITIKGISKSEGELIGFYLFKDNVNDACGYSVENDNGAIKIIYTCCC